MHSAQSAEKFKRCYCSRCGTPVLVTTIMLKSYIVKVKTSAYISMNSGAPFLVQLELSLMCYLCPRQFAKGRHFTEMVLLHFNSCKLRFRESGNTTTNANNAMTNLNNPHMNFSLLHFKCRTISSSKSFSNQAGNL